MSNRIFPLLTLFLVSTLSSGCAAFPFLSFLPIMGSAYEGSLEKSVTTVVISIPTFVDKHYVELFYRLVDDNLPKKAAVGKEKTQ